MLVGFANDIFRYAPPLPNPASERESSDDALEQQRIGEVRQRIAELARSLQREQDRDIAAAQLDIQRLIIESRSNVSCQATLSAAPLQGFRNVARCVWLGARDQVTGSDRFAAHVADSLQPSIALLIDCECEINVVLAALHQRTLARANDFLRKSLELASAEGLDPAQVRLSPELNRALGSPADRLQRSATSATLSSGVELVLIKLTADSVWQVLRPLIRKAAKTAGAAGFAAVVDGPIPAGDAVGAVIALAGGALTAWDIRKAVRAHEVLPGEIESVLRQQLDHLENAAVDQLESQRCPLDSIHL